MPQERAVTVGCKRIALTCTVATAAVVLCVCVCVRVLVRSACVRESACVSACVRPRLIMIITKIIILYFPRLIMITTKIIILYFIQIRHTDDFHSTGTRLVCIRTILVNLLMAIHMVFKRIIVNVFLTCKCRFVIFLFWQTR